VPPTALREAGVGLVPRSKSFFEEGRVKRQVPLTARCYRRTMTAGGAKRFSDPRRSIAAESNLRDPRMSGWLKLYE
jgi:hypothetical protein